MQNKAYLSLQAQLMKEKPIFTKNKKAGHYKAQWGKTLLLSQKPNSITNQNIAKWVMMRYQKQSWAKRA